MSTTSKEEDNESSSSVLTICAIQPTLRSDDQTPRDAIHHAVDLMRRASKEASTKIDLFVLPELAPIGYSEDTFANYLPLTVEKQQLYHDLDKEMVKVAKELEGHICYGTIGWYPAKEDTNSDAATFKLTIRQVVVDPKQGGKVAIYDKMYPCDFGDCAETRFFVPSPSMQPVSLSIGNFRIGIIICADQRVPTLCRRLAKEHQVDVILQPAAFYRDVSFPTWKSFRETRAVENSVYFLGVNYAGKDYGDTTLVLPWVDYTPKYTPQSLDRDEGWMMCQIQRSILDEIRTTFPFYRVLQQEGD